MRLTNFPKIAISLAIFAVIALGSASTTKADQVTVQGINFPQLQATINITSLTNGSITFSVTNVLVAGFTSSITGIGFELPGVITANTPGTCAGSCGNFTLTPTVDNDPGTVPNFPAAVLDWAVITGANNFSGGNPPGINQGQTATFTVTGNFTGLTQAQFLAGVFVRFQAVNCPTCSPPINDGSDVAHSVIPEPTTMLLLGTGLVGVAAGIRRRRKSGKL